MTSIGIEATITGEHKLQEIIGRLENPVHLLHLVGGMLEDYEKDVFASGDHGQWLPDEPVTAELKGQAAVLVSTGQLMQNLTLAHVQGETAFVSAGDAMYAQYQSKKRDPAPAPESSKVESWARKIALYIVDGEGV